MGAIDTTYTFTATDTITSTKMNNIIDQTTMTSDAIVGTTLDVASGKLKVRAAGITSNEMGNNSVVTAAITDSNVTTAKIADANVTQAKLAPNVVGNGPAFRAWASSTTTLNNNIETKVNLNTEVYDTNNNYDTSNSRFLPTIAGYYQINCTVYVGSAPQYLQVFIFKNGTKHSGAVHTNVQTFASNVSDLIYCNGTTDYIEMYAIQQSGANHLVGTNIAQTYMSGFLARSA